MNVENLIAFIWHGINIQRTRGKMLLGSMGICAFATFACMDGFVYDMNTLIYTITVFLLSIAFIIVLSLFSRVLNIKTRIICDLIITSFTIIISSLSGKIYLYMNGVSHSTLISLVPLIFALISLLTSFIAIKKNKYIKKNNNPNLFKLVVMTTVGVVACDVIMKVYADTISEFISADIFIGALFLLIASAFAFTGAPSFLKIYYINILNQMGIDLDK